jgi:clan AA aspartic protease
MTRIKLTNPTDLDNAGAGLILPEEVRCAETEALVDTGAVTLVLPRDMCERLGLQFRGTRRVRYANGTTAVIPWTSVRVEILGRETICKAYVEAPGTTPLIGQIPLEALDLVVDPKSRDVHVNPASPDMPLLDLLAVA